jgi:putative serine protease PepD
VLALIIAAILGGLIGGAVASGILVGLLGLTKSGQQAVQRVEQVASSATAASSVNETESSQPIEEAAAKVTPSVVNVAIQKSISDPFTGQSSVQTVGNGSGVIVRADGYVLTNYHVVQGADKILVHIGLEDKPAKVVGTDPSTDIAVVKVDVAGLTAAAAGNSDALKVGQTVIAVGSPFGLDKTVTSGIVSALHRSGDTGGSSSTYTNLIQTDASINPGNSGGALVDLDGKVIGINTLIQSPSGQVGAPQSAGIGFAIPIKLAMDIGDQLIATGKAKHPFLGVQMQTLDAQLAAQLKLTQTSGALVQDVVSSSPAGKAGIKKGDVIVAIGTSDVQTAQDAITAIRAEKVGASVPVKLWRAGKTLTVTVVLGEAPATSQ